ncbi:YggS family pyridoxal phosphate-dependent enzyme [Candidatus Peregrinibacteria bacterium]|jgi:PLP dependent protein|nr:YggS family pyridoxal phosphate-dependent enzyme [Candidatus Peregrinibacteria bacterium]
MSNSAQKIKTILKDLSNATLIVVTKNQPKDILEALLQIPETKHIGENRLQDFKERFCPDLYIQFKKQNISFHFIGHLQTNKVKEVIKYFDLIQSVDSIKLLEKINEEARKTNKIQRILLEVNISEDPAKHGFTTTSHSLEEAIQKAQSLPNIQLEGLMTILAINLTEEEQSENFSKLKTLSNKFNLPITSMGMSQDYRIAIKAGSNMVRIGSKVFN